MFVVAGLFLGWFGFTAADCDKQGLTNAQCFAKVVAEREAPKSSDFNK